MARLSGATSPLSGDARAISGFVGGIEAVSVTIPDCELDDTDITELVEGALQSLPRRCAPPFSELRCADPRRCGAWGHPGG